MSKFGNPDSVFESTQSNTYEHIAFQAFLQPLKSYYPVGTYCHPRDVEQTSCYIYVHVANKSILLSLTCDSTFHLLFSCFCTGLQVISSCSQPLNEKMKAKCHSYMRRKHLNNMSLSCLNRTILVTCLFHHIMHSPYPRESDETQF